MGREIGTRIWDTKDLIDKLKECGAHDIDLLMSILKECGTFLPNGSHYALSFDNNDCFFEDGDPSSVLCKLLQAAFGVGCLEVGCVLFYRCSGVNILIDELSFEDIAKRLGTKLKDDDDDD